MASYTAQLEGTAAIASNTAFAWLMAVANTGFVLTRVTIGVRATTAVPTSMQAVVGINRVTTAGTTPTSGPTPQRADTNSAAAQCLWISAFATPPTTSTDDAARIPLNTLATISLPTKYRTHAATTVGYAFINRDNALPTSHQFVITVEWDE